MTGDYQRHRGAASFSLGSTKYLSLEQGSTRNTTSRKVGSWQVDISFFRSQRSKLRVFLSLMLQMPLFRHSLCLETGCGHRWTGTIVSYKDRRPTGNSPRHRHPSQFCAPFSRFVNWHLHPRPQVFLPKCGPQAGPSRASVGQPGESDLMTEFSAYRLKYNYEFLETLAHPWARGKSSNQ
jgi:hypothetical protein